MDEHLQEVAIELTDAAIDTLTESELVKEIPVVGTLVRLAKATHSISDRIFAKTSACAAFLLFAIQATRKNT